MEAFRCKRRIIELRGKNGERGILKLMDQPEGLKCFLITEIPDYKTIYLKSTNGMLSVSMKDSYIITNLRADEISAVAVVYNEDVCLTGGVRTEWSSHIKKNEIVGETKKAFKINREERLLKKQTENKKINEDSSKNLDSSNNEMNNMLLKMLPQFLLKNKDKDNTDMSKLFSMMEMLNGKTGKDSGMTEKMMALLSNNTNNRPEQENILEKEHGKESLDYKEDVKEKLKENLGQTEAEKDAREGTVENKTNSTDALNIETQEAGGFKEQNKKEIIEEPLEEYDEAHICDLNIFEWEKVEYPFPRSGHYISGSATIQGKKAYAIGIPGEFSYKPPAWQGEFTRFFNYSDRGYWVKVVTQKEKDGLDT